MKALFKEGTYTAEAQGNGGIVKVEVTFTATEIKDIKILSQIETAGLGDAALEKIRLSILAIQTLAVDTISGATYSSNAILKAVEDCVKQAGGQYNSYDPERQKM
ncbi:MAG: FMN-binding protein [Sedimentibacter sp.]